MKKLVFVSLLGSLAAPAGALAQDDETAVPEATTTATSAPEAEAAEEEEGSWTDGLTFNIFADSFYQQDWNFPNNPADVTSAVHRDYNYTDGFGLSFVGVDAAYAGEHFGATISLRYGPAAERYAIGYQLRVDGDGDGAPDITTGSGTPALVMIKQAYGTIIPTEGLTIDVGLWDTIYGAEVADSWVNLNYTRSPLNYLMQPFYHLGVRAAYQVSDSIVIKGLVANPTNAYTAFNDIPYVGAQIGYTSENFSLYAGYMGGEFNIGDEGKETWEHFVDVVGIVTAGDLTATVNFDLWHNPIAGGPSAQAWGVSGAVGYQISDLIGVAGRVDFLENSDQYFLTGYNRLVAATGTLDVRPWDDNVIIRLEHRFEQAFGGAPDVFVTSRNNAGVRDTWQSTIASVVVRTGN